jgi:PadR family transcriptional regulator PadR
MSTEWRRYRGAYDRFQMQPAKISTTAFVQLYILHMLQGGREMYGHEMIKAMEERFKGSDWRPSPSVVYPVLRTMVEQGWLTYQKEDPMTNSKKYYRMTQAGWEFFQRKKAEYRPKIDSSIELLLRAREDIYGKTPRGH